MISYADYAQKVEELERYSKEIYVIKKENARLKEALRNIHNYIANPDDRDDMLGHILDIDQMVLNALYEEGEEE